MKANTHIRIVVAGAAFASLCATAWLGGSAGGLSQFPWYSIVPPALAIILAFLTHHVIFSLGVALLVGGFLSTVPGATGDLAAWLHGLGATGNCLSNTLADRTNRLILSFIPPIFTMVEIIMATGGFLGIVTWLLRRIRTNRSAQLATSLMGMVCFIDDYASAIIVGSMMQPITDRFRISREKLAFLVDATSAPVSGLAIVSTWIAYEVGLFADVSEQLGLDKTGYAMFFDALAFRFYCLLMLGFMFTQILLGREFGPMREAENRARNNNSNSDTRSSRDLQPAGTGVPAARAINALLPLGGLVTFHLTGLWLDGGGISRFAGVHSLVSADYWRQVITAAEHSNHMLLFAALFGIVLALMCGGLTGSLKAAVLPGCLWRGVKRAALPAVVLTLAWSLKSCCDTLGTGQFLTGLLAERIQPHWYPPLLFIVACIVSFATGTSWGTMAILIPTAIPTAFALDGNSYGQITMISLAAVLDGAIFGDHCSPISDTTILSSTASSCGLLEHVRTQLPYSVTVAAVALVCAYIPSALGLKSIYGIVLSIAVLIAVLFAVGRRPGRQHVGACPRNGAGA